MNEHYILLLTLGIKKKAKTYKDSQLSPPTLLLYAPLRALGTTLAASSGLCGCTRPA